MPSMARKNSPSVCSKTGCLRSAIVFMSPRNQGTHWALPLYMEMGRRNNFSKSGLFELSTFAMSIDLMGLSREQARALIFSWKMKGPLLSAAYAELARTNCGIGLSPRG